MKTPILIAAAILSSAALTALAADPPKDAPKKELTPQQQRMSDCSHASKGLKGDEHKQFMSECLKKDSTIDVSKPAVSAGKSEPKVEPKPEPKPVGGKPGTESPKQSQQDKMKSCNKLADKDKLKGDDRKKFMSDCLKGAA